MNHIYSSLDIGSDAIKLVVCEYKDKLNVLAAITEKADGITKGLITNPELAKKSIKAVFVKAEEMLGIKIRRVIANISSYLVDYKLVTSEVSINENVTNEDISRLLKKAISNNLDSEREYISILPFEFKIDETITKMPLNKNGKTLKVKANLITTPKKNVYSVGAVLESIGVEIAELSVNSVGDLYTFKNESFKKTAGAIINIGAETTTINLYNREIPIKTKIIDIAGKSIDKDISYIYKLPNDKAKAMKEKFAYANKKGSSVNDVYEIDNKKINQFELSEIVESRVEEILKLSKNELKLLTNKDFGYIIITGGISNMALIEHTANQVFANSKVGTMHIIGARNNIYSTAIGNILYFIDNLKLRNADYSMLSKKDMEYLSSPDSENISNDTMLGKVVGYFFGE